MHSLVAVTGGTNACWQGSGKSANRVPFGIDNVLKNGASCSVFAFIPLSCITTGAERPPFCFAVFYLSGHDLALQGGQCQFDPLGVLGVGLLEVLELGRDDGVILHIDEGARQVGGEP
jgi:hypothetical protein